jgi:hypothetical protein
MSTRINITLDESSNKRLSVFRYGEKIIIENGKHNEVIELTSDEQIQNLQLALEILQEEIETARARESAIAGRL